MSILWVKHTYYYHHRRDQKTRDLEECLSQDHKAHKWQNWNLNQGESSSKARRKVLVAELVPPQQTTPEGPQSLVSRTAAGQTQGMQVCPALSLHSLGHSPLQEPSSSRSRSREGAKPCPLLEKKGAGKGSCGFSVERTPPLSKIPRTRSCR